MNPREDPLQVLEGTHSMAMLVHLLDGPCTKMELYHSVANGAGMLNKKVDILQNAGLVTMVNLGGHVVTVSLTEKGVKIAEHLKAVDELLGYQ